MNKCPCCGRELKRASYSGYNVVASFVHCGYCNKDFNVEMLDSVVRKEL